MERLVSSSTSPATFNWLALVTFSIVLITASLPFILGKKQVDYFKLSGVPRPTPLLNFDIHHAKPRPYRPFRWPYHQTMALMKMEPDYWLELESTYEERIAQRLDIYRKETTAILDSSPEADWACTELMEMVIQFLCVRYPKLFRYNHRNGIFWNGIRKMDFSTRAIAPLRFLLENVPEEFAVMLEDKESGLYYLRAGVVISAIGWNLHSKMGRPMHEIHLPVPDYKEKMQSSVDRYFTKTTCDKPIQRGSWGLEVGQPLYLQTDDPHWSLRDRQDPALSIDDIHLRVDWQTLRRLPRSNAIVFNFKALFTPLTEFRREPFIPRLVSTILKEGSEGIMEYKGTHHTLHKVLPALEEWADEQENNGLVPKNWRVRTLDENPFYPGWDSTRT